MDPILRFRSKLVRHIDGCTEWTGAKDKDGYGIFQLESRKTVRALRWWWEVHRGPIPRGKVIRHRCDNPPCMRLSHLLLGTAADNTRDRVNRLRSAVGQRHPFAVMNEDLVREVRARVAAGEQVRPLARALGVSRGCIQGIVTRKTWKHI